MRVALYVTAWPPGEYPSGIVTYASQLVPALRKLGHEVFILTFRKSADDLDPHTIDLRRFASRTLWDRVLLRVAPVRTSLKEISTVLGLALKELIANHGLDVFEIEESFGLSYDVGRMNLLPIVVRLHGPWLLNGIFTDPGAISVNRRRVKLEGKGIHCADFVTTPAANALKIIKKHYRLDLKAHRVIRNPVEAAAAQDTWNIHSCTNNAILFVGRFDTLKGGDLILRAFASLAALYPQLTLTFVGPDVGINSANGELLSFREFVQSSLPEGCHSRIDFRGPMKQRDIMQLRTEHFLTVVASQQEMMPYSVLEAMSLGCPLVVTAVGGIPEMITHQQNGLLVPSQDVKAMTAACQTLLDDDALAARLGRQAWQDCREYYRPDNIANETIAAYEEAINNYSMRNPC